MLIDGYATKAYSIAVSDVTGQVTTIEGLSTLNSARIVQEEWIANQVAQCGYCQSGQVLTAVSLLAEQKSPTDEDIVEAFEGNLCRCCTYPRIKQAVRSASARISG